MVGIREGVMLAVSVHRAHKHTSDPQHSCREDVGLTPRVGVGLTLGQMWGLTLEQVWG